MRFDKKPRNVLHALDELAATHSGSLTPELVIKEARNAKSPLHDEFVWDNSRAGHLYRIQQARGLLRIYKVQKISPSGRKMESRQFYRVSIESGEPKKYVSAKKVFSDPDLTRRAAVEALVQFRRSLALLEPFPQYFSELLEAVNREIGNIKIEESPVKSGAAAS